MIAILLTILNAVVTVYYGVAIWMAGSGNIWGCRLLVLLAASGATALANVWIQAVIGSGASLSSRGIERGGSATPIPGEARGHGDV